MLLQGFAKAVLGVLFVFFRSRCEVLEERQGVKRRGLHDWSWLFAFCGILNPKLNLNPKL